MHQEVKDPFFRQTSSSSSSGKTTPSLDLAASRLVKKQGADTALSAFASVT